MLIKKESDKVVLIPENYEDLVDLYLTLQPKDVICSKATVVIKGDETTEKEKRKIYLCLEIEELFIDPHSKSLRIRWKVLNAPKDIPLTRLTITIRIGDCIETEWKEEFKEFKQNIRKTYALSIDDYSACLAELFRGNYKILNIWHRNNRELEDYIGEIVGYLRKFNPENLIICGPMFYKELVKKQLEKGVLIDTSYGGEEGIRELLKRKELLDYLQEFKEKEKVEKLRKALVDLINEKASVGEEALADLENGNVEEIFISRDYLKRLKESKNYELMDKLLKLPKQYGAKIYIIEGENDEAKQLYFLGGFLVKKRW